jgi:hypothetical protein
VVKEWMGVPSYYGREKILHLDGTSVFANETDRGNEAEIARKLERVWRCSIRPFGALCPVDWYAERDGRLVGVLELKSRAHESGKYPTVFLNVRKWLALSLATVGLGCPAIYVVRFSDGVYWCSLSEIDARVTRIGGCTTVVKSHNDIEPIIVMELAKMKRVEE